MAGPGGSSSSAVRPEGSLVGLTPERMTLPLHNRAGVEKQLFDQPYCFDFFQVVLLLERLQPGRRPVGRSAGNPRDEAVRFRALPSLSFPPSPIYNIDQPRDLPMPRMTVAFMGLTGPAGVLPRHYTDLVMRQEREADPAEKGVLREWLDLFNHRLISLFFRAWEKYRLFVPYYRGEFNRPEPDPFTRVLFSLLGMYSPTLRQRMQVAVQAPERPGEPGRRLVGINDLRLLRYAGILAQRPRNAVNAEAFLKDFFGLPIRVKQFQGQWLALDPASRSRMQAVGGNNELGVNVVAGEQIWDIQSKIRIVVGPLRYAEFLELLPDRRPARERKGFFLLCHLTRFYLGPEFDFDVQIILRKEDVPACQLKDDGGLGPRLGWNTWMLSKPAAEDKREATFEGVEVYNLPSD